MRDSRHQSNPTAERSGLFHAQRRKGAANTAGARGALFGAVFLLASLFTAGSALAQSPSEGASPAASLAPLPSAAPSFPLTVTDDEGTSISLAAEPKKIVSLSPSNTEIVFSIGGGDRLVGGTDADDYPAEAAALPDVVVQTKVQDEQIVALDPDLILANGGGLTPQADIDQLRQLGYPVMVLSATSLDGVERDIALIGEAIGGYDAATTTVATMQSQVQDIESAVADVSTIPRTFYEIGYGPDIYAPPADSVYAQMITLAKGAPVTGDASYTIPLEQLIQADPQVILLGDAAYGTCPSDVASRQGWQDITAVKDGAVRPANDTVITRPGPRMPLGLASLVRGIHPEITLPEFPPEPALCASQGSPAPSGSATP
jgi:iron complex transport system substrate-binding protein